MKYTYPAVFEPDGERGIAIWFPDLPRGASAGKDYEHAISMAQDALTIILDSYDEDKLPYPDPGSVKEPLEPGQSIVNITVERER